MMCRRRVLGGLLMALGGLAGCGEHRAAFVTNRPGWDYEHYPRIAVLPGRAADRRAVRDADVLSDRLTTLLTQNGAFTVLSRIEMDQVFAEQDLSKLADAIDEGTALPEGRIKVAQALVSTRITDYKLIAERERKTVPRYAVDRQGRRLLDRAGRPIIVGEDVFYIYRHGAEVEGSVRVIDAATGKILISHSARVVPHPRTSRERPPSTTPEEMATEAVGELAIEFFKEIAPTQVKVKFDSDMLILATDYFDGRYDEIKKVPRAGTEFLLVVRNLPPQCDRNKFHVALAEEQGRENLFEQEFTWSGSSGPEGVSYRVPLDVLTRAGGEKFVAKLYSAGDPEPKLVRKFSLEALKAK